MMTAMPHIPCESLPRSNRTPQAEPDTILVVDDSKMQRKMLTSALRKWGYDVVDAGSGEEALAICRTRDIRMVISDWIMPGMDGPELCRRYRKIDRLGYGYFVLLTSKDGSSDVALGLDAGADDFLTKPVTFGELKARLRAGGRVVKMQAELLEKNTVLNTTLRELREVHANLDRDLLEARTLQQSLLRETYVQLDGGNISMLLRSSGQVGGDLVGQFQINKDQVGLFSLDVSGHGVTPALLISRLAGYLNGHAPAQNIALEDQQGRYVARPPAQTVSLLNELLLHDLRSDLYVTMALAIVDLSTGIVDGVQAGHPHPILCHADGHADIVGDGGCPMGLFERAAYEPFQIQMRAGGRLILHSDGLTDCVNPSGEAYQEARLMRLIQKCREASGPKFLDAVTASLEDFSKGEEFADDVSALVFDYTDREA